MWRTPSLARLIAHCVNLRILRMLKTVPIYSDMSMDDVSKWALLPGLLVASNATPHIFHTSMIPGCLYIAQPGALKPIHIVVRGTTMYLLTSYRTVLNCNISCGRQATGMLYMGHVGYARYVGYSSRSRC